MDQASPVLNHIIGTIPAGAKVVVHCMGGLSRAGTFASLYLWLRGMGMHEAIGKVREIRGLHAINPRQVAFLMRVGKGHDVALYESEASS